MALAKESRSGSQMSAESRPFVGSCLLPADSLPMTNVTCCPCDLAVRREAFAWTRKLRTDVRGRAIGGVLAEDFLGYCGMSE